MNSKKNSIWRLRPHPSILYSSLLLVLLLSPKGNCAELRPYELPSEKRPIYQQRYDAPAQKPAYASFDYAAFGEKAAKLPPAERTKLKEGLRERRNRALEEKNFEEASHYERLFKIVDDIR